MTGATYNEILAAWDWEPIRNCPGRYALRRADPRTRLEDLMEAPVAFSQFNTAAAIDLVFVVKLDRGGLISYCRSDGSFLHTLNNEDGFLRKLDQLGIDIEADVAPTPLKR